MVDYFRKTSELKTQVSDGLATSPGFCTSNPELAQIDSYWKRTQCFGYD